MTQLERVQYTVKAHTTGGFGLLSRFLVVLFAAALSLASIATVFAQQSAEKDPQTQGASRRAPRKPT